MITLTNVSSARGAPMGRRRYGNMDDAEHIAIEWMPFVDGDYDCGGAYFGGGEPIYCVAGFVGYGTDDQEEIAREYIRADDRESAWEQTEGGGRALLPETGSIVKQTIEFLQQYMDGEDDEDIIADTENDIEELQGWLEDKGLK